MVNGIVSPLPLTSSPKRLSCTPFFILTTGRSGSTLLRAILNQHDDVCIPPESNKLGQIVRDFLQTFRYLKWQQVVSLVTAEFQKERGFSFWEVELTAFFAQAANTASKDYNLAYLIDLFYNYYLQVHKPDAVRWGDKSVKNAFNLAHISNLFPDAQYIHIYRGGRDVATSLFQEGLCPNPETGAEQWMKAITNIHDFGRTLPESRFLEISYENLVQNPEQTIQAVCEYLSLDFQPKLLDFWNNTENLGDANRSLHENLKNPINNDAIGKWKKSLDISQQTLVEMRLRGILSELGYK
jgi:LPS sulfotransferase NodH